MTRGRPRSARVDKAVQRATVDLLAEVGYGRLRVDEVAARAGVGKAAIYRRWRSKPELVFAQVMHDLDIEPPPDTGSLRGDLAVLVADLVDSMVNLPAGPVLPELVAELVSDPALLARFNDTYLALEQRCVATVLDRAVARGELTSQPELAWAHAQLVGPVYVWLYLLRGQPSQQLVTRAVDAIVATWQAQGEG
jgi:AcrR family transcriptional regulator